MPSRPSDARAAVFPMHEPDGYPPANDMVIEEAARSDGRLVPFCRLDPACRPAARGRARPRARRRGDQAPPPRGGLRARHASRCTEVFALADERRAAGTGARRAAAYPRSGATPWRSASGFPNVRLILAHAGICDLAWIWRATAEHPNLFFDTAWWSASDLLSAVRAGAPAPHPLRERRPLRHADLRGVHEPPLRAAGGAHDRADPARLRRAAAPHPVAGRSRPTPARRRAPARSTATRCSTACTRSSWARSGRCCTARTPPRALAPGGARLRGGRRRAAGRDLLDRARDARAARAPGGARAPTTTGRRGSRRGCRWWCWPRAWPARRTCAMPPHGRPTRGRR